MSLCQICESYGPWDCSEHQWVENRSQPRGLIQWIDTGWREPKMSDSAQGSRRANPWEEPGRVRVNPPKGTWMHLLVTLPTVDGMSTGVIGVSGNLTTVQCSVCLRTYTDETFWAVKEMNFAPDGEESRRGWTKYRRCRSCREAGKHPQK